MSRPPTSPDDFGEDDPTVIDGTPLADFDSPATMPRCVVCGRVVFFDDFTNPASALAMGLFSSDRCVRSRPDVVRWWRWCCEIRTAEFYVPP